MDYSGKHIDFLTFRGKNCSYRLFAFFALSKKAPYLFQPETGEVVHLPEARGHGKRLLPCLMTGGYIAT